MLGAERGRRTRLAGAAAPKLEGADAHFPREKGEQSQEGLGPRAVAWGHRGWCGLLPLDPEGGKETQEAP